MPRAMRRANSRVSDCEDESGVGLQNVVPASGFEPLTPRV